MRSQVSLPLGVLLDALVSSAANGVSSRGNASLSALLLMRVWSRISGRTQAGGKQEADKYPEDGRRKVQRN